LVSVKESNGLTTMKNNDLEKLIIAHYFKEIPVFYRTDIQGVYNEMP
jgi:hypothetical protein